MVALVFLLSSVLFVLKELFERLPAIEGTLLLAICRDPVSIVHAYVFISNGLLV